MSLVLFVPPTAWKKIGILAILISVLIPSAAFAATLSFSPKERSYDVGATFTVVVSANSGGAALNAVSGVVSFPAELLEVVSVSKAASVMSLWVQEPTFSNAQGTIQFEGIVLNPGYTGTSGTIVSITFKTKKSGVAKLSFPSGSILANDGTGTEILASRGSAVFTIASASVVEAPTPTGGEATSPSVGTGSDTNEGAVAVTSAPVVEQSDVRAQGWSKEISGTFTFSYGPDVTSLRLLLDSSPNSIPVVEYAPPLVSKVIDDLPSGVSYLHVQTKTAEGWSEVTHHKIAIDTSEPEALTVLEQKSRDESSGVKVFTLQSSDSLSGVERFEVVLDGATAEVFTAGEYVTYVTPTLPSGTHTLLVRSFDMAGNVTEKTIEFIVAETVPVLSEVGQKANDFSVVQLVSAGTALITILSVVVPTLALILVLCTLLLFGLRHYRRYRKLVHKEVAEAQEVTRRVFTLIKSDLETDILMLEKARKKRKLSTEETKLLKHIKENIAGAEKMISDEIQDIAPQ